MKQRWCNPKLITEEEFCGLFHDSDSLIVKTANGLGGREINIKHVQNNLKEIYKEVVSLDYPVIVEEYFHQKGILNKINPTSLNTVRIVTLREKNSIITIFAKFRAGRKNAVVDNSHSGGVAYTVDINSGKILEGTTMNGKQFHHHPGTNMLVSGTVIPKWNEANMLCHKAHLLAPEGLNMIGWDVCISEDVIFLIEGNESPIFPKRIGKEENAWKYIQGYLTEFDQRKRG